MIGLIIRLAGSRRGIFKGLKRKGGEEFPIQTLQLRKISKKPSSQYKSTNPISHAPNAKSK
jgi:hypothetical protein